MASDLHAALLDDCRRLAEIAPAELAGAVAALRLVIEEHGKTWHNQRGEFCMACHDEVPCRAQRVIAAELGIGVTS